jgi:hypothetical protein
MSTDAFIPQGYEVPTSGGGFTKLEDGDNTFRVLSNPYMMWTLWTDGKPTRVAYDPKNKPAKGAGDRDSVKHSWGLIVWNYNTEQIEVFELDKQTVIGQLTAYANNPKWGHPKKYDIVINKSGSGKETEYKLVVEPHSEPSKQIVDGFLATPIDLSQLLVADGNVFLGSAAAPAAPAAPAGEPKPNTAAQAFEAPAQEEGKEKLPF